ncbi:MAG TPA: LLM class flavin-dependent oxidoreductase [Candidatus Binataceae bacterium]
MSKRIYFNAFHMNCVVHQSPGLWVHPEDQMHRYRDLRAWVDLAQMLERGKFDGLFLADVIGVYDVFRASRDVAVKGGVQIPVNDPSLLIPAMALATEHLGFAYTSSVLQSHPFTFARQISTLDHLTKGRVAWNIVASYLESSGRNFGRIGLLDHDERYDFADEYLEVCYKLWESSWEDGAVLEDRRQKIYADPARIHDIHHEGRNFKVHGCHLSEPSPQRTPVLYQAGASARGRQFAARHAECVFVTGPRPEVVAECIRDTRARARKEGRDPQDLLFFMFLKVITGATEAEARRKYDDFLEYVDYEGGLALLGGWTGVDFSRFEPDQPVEYIETNAIRSLLQGFTQGGSTRKWTVRDVARAVGIGGGGPVVVGAPEQVADDLMQWVRAGADGFNLAYMITPGTFKDFIEGVVPVLQRRGLMQTEYGEETTYREKLFGSGRSRLPDRHPGARYARAREK